MNFKKASHLTQSIFFQRTKNNMFFDKSLFILIQFDIPSIYLGKLKFIVENLMPEKLMASCWLLEFSIFHLHWGVFFFFHWLPLNWRYLHLPQPRQLWNIFRKLIWQTWEGKTPEASFTVDLFSANPTVFVEAIKPYRVEVGAMKLSGYQKNIRKVILESLKRFFPRTTISMKIYAKWNFIM